MTSKAENSNRGQWIPLALIMAGVAGWGIYHVIGAIRSGQSLTMGLTKALIISVSVAIFLGGWGLALYTRSRRVGR